MNLPSAQPLLEHFGVFVSAITGVLAARGKQIDLFGVLALVTAFGGGTVRDVLVGDLPVAWLRGPALLINATLAALLTFFIARWRELPRRALLVADAFALAFFTMLGTQKGVALHFSPPVAVLLGSVEKIVEAATMANAHDFIMALSRGYDAFIGEKGEMLSGGNGRGSPSRGRFSRIRRS